MKLKYVKYDNKTALLPVQYMIKFPFPLLLRSNINNKVALVAKPPS